jgi:hypothetical protein
MGCVHVLWIARRTANVGVDLSRVDPVSMDQRNESTCDAMEGENPPSREHGSTAACLAPSVCVWAR